MRSEAESVLEYVESLPDDRAAAIEAVREVILENLAEGFVESMNWGMITYEIPLDTHPDTYNGKPLMYAALASQKNHMAVYLTGMYATSALRNKFVDDYKATGKKLDMGQSCVRFTKLDQLPLSVIGDAISAYGVSDFIELVGQDRGSRS